MGKRKFYAAVFVEILSAILLGCLLLYMQSALSMQSQRVNSAGKLAEAAELLAKNSVQEAETISVYDQLYVSKADTAAFLMRSIHGYEYTTEHMKELKDRLSVDNVAVLDSGRNVQASAAPFEAETEGTRTRYYTSAIDENAMVIIEKQPKELYTNLEHTTSLHRTLGGIAVGLNGYVFAVSVQDHTFSYHPDAALIGSDVLINGMTEDDLTDDFDGFLTVDDERLYCTSRQFGDNYIFCAVPKEELTASRNTTVLVVLLSYILITSIVILYAYLLEKDEEKDLAEAVKQPARRPRFRAGVGKKIIPAATVGMIAVFLISFYMQTLFSLSQQSMANNRKVADIGATLAENAQEVADLTEQYSTQYLDKCRIAAYVLSSVEQEQLTQEFMKELQSALQIRMLSYFDMNGQMIATNSDFWDFALSDDPEDQSYEFRAILAGTKQEIIQDAKPDETGGDLTQYIAVAVTDENHHATGFVQIGVSPTRLQNMLGNTDTASVLGGIRSGKHGFAFAVTKEDHTFLYWPQERLIGKDALAYGMREFQFTDGYCDYITVGGTQYYCSSFETDDLYVYAAVPYDAIMVSRLPVSVSTALAGLICLTLIVLLLVFDHGTAAVPAVKNVPTPQPAPKKAADTAAEDKFKDDPDMIDVELGDGRVSKSQSALSRWSYRAMDWEQRTAGQKLSSIVGVIAGIVSLFFLAVVLLPGKMFGENSLMYWIMKGNWQRSLNVFSVTSSLIVSIAVFTCSILFRRLLMWFARSLDARAETVFRLTDNFIKFATMIGIIYYCLTMVGVDTATLVASAGILTLIVGLGAQSLVNDILAGLFIVFEGEFQVGDIVTIGDFRGTVLEIGIRTTKVKESTGNIKVFANRNVTNVVNMTKDLSSVTCTVHINCTQTSLDFVESVLKKELQMLAKKLPAAAEGPNYKGVAAIEGNGVSITVAAKCMERDRAQLAMDLNRELKLILDRNGICTTA